jgi:regulator of sirC expression with transglutaminase-like and TPR domain
MSDPGLAPEPWLAELDRLAAVARPRLAGRGLREQLARLARLLFDEQGFRGNTVDYYDPRNNFLNEVLARRLGVPISLALVMVEVGRRAGLTVYGVGLPGHFVVGASAGDERVYVDALNAGAELDAAGMIRLIEAALGGPAVLDREWLRPVTPREFVGRLCANLQGAYLLQNDLARAIRATERQFLFGGDPDSLRDLGFLYIQTGQLQRAASALESYLLNRPHVEDAEEVQAGLQAVYQCLALSG